MASNSPSSPNESSSGVPRTHLVSGGVSEIIHIRREHWQTQTYVLLVSIALLIAYCVYHRYYMIATDVGIEAAGWGVVCVSEPFDPWMKPYLFPIVTACISHAFTLYFRAFMSLYGYGSDGKLRHPNATRLMLAIATIQAAAISSFYFDLLPTTCTSFLGMKTPYFLWIQWICTVPYLFFLVSVMDVKRQYMRRDDIYIEVLGGGAIVFLFVGNFTDALPRVIHWIFFTAANIMMTLALAWQHYQAYCECAVAKKAFDDVVVQRKQTLSDLTPLNAESPSLSTPSTSPALTLSPAQQQAERDCHDTLKVAQCKLNAAMFMSVWLTIVPTIYYIHYLYPHTFTAEMYILSMYTVGYLVKVLFTHLLIDSHVEILDPNKFLVIEERAKAEESRLMFLRYVFHEVRVPLNSVVLGLQLLQDNEALVQRESDRETLHMMKDATSFMAETLNDVLSLQKIEQGMLKLECKPFSPKRLVDAVISTFRGPSEAKRIRIVPVIPSTLSPSPSHQTIPRYVLGDQFRLEHVLGNLLSNAIKFSDEDSVVEVHVGTTDSDSDDKVSLTFTVKDFGRGMSPGDQKMLFQPFMQIRPGELQKGRGSGLGLSICKTIVQLHGGTIGCRSSKRERDADSDGESVNVRSQQHVTGGGSEFYFTIEFDRVDEGFMDTVCGCASQSCAEGESERTGVDDDNVRASIPVPTVSMSASTSMSVSESDSDSDVLSAAAASTASKTTAAADNAESPRGKTQRRVIADENYISVIPVPQSRPMTRSLSRSQIQSNVENSNTSVPVPLTVSISQDITHSHVIGNVMVCDDVLSNRKMLEMVLKRKGLSHCVQAVDGSQAVSLIEQHGLTYFDLVFMDSIMPVLSGPLATQQLRAMGYAGLVIGVTGNAMDSDVREYEEAGADMVLTKPVRVDILDLVLSYCRQHGCVSHFNYRDPVTGIHATLPENHRLKYWVNNK